MAMSVLETERLVLRPFVDDDLDALAAVFAEPAVWQYPVGRGFTREESRRFLARQILHRETHGFGMWAAELKSSQELTGFIGLAIPTFLPVVLPAVEVGWRLHPDHWGKGLATEGGRASLRFGFEKLHLDRIISIFMPENEASGRVMAKLGMRECLTTRDPERGMLLSVTEIDRVTWQAICGGAPSGRS